jgi:hypothetical protein
MPKTDRILNLLPHFYRARDTTKLLAYVVRALAEPLEDADTHLLRIQRAHRLEVAEHVEDIVQLAAALNLDAFHFEDILTDNDLEYDTKLQLMRQRVKRIARIHLRGSGTPWAVVEGAAAFLNAAIVSDRPDDPLIKHLDSGGFSHQATIEFSHLPDRRREQIYLHENPVRRAKVDPAERWQLNFWDVNNRNVDQSPAKFVLRGVSDHTVLPSIFCPDTQEGLLFNGVIPEGKTLVIDRDGATLDDLPVDQWLIYFKGGVFDFSGADSSDWVTEQQTSSTRFDPDLERAVISPVRKRPKLPAVPIGKSLWHIKVAEGSYDSTDFDYCVFATNSQPVGAYDGDFNFDDCVFDYPGVAVVGMGWDERIPCALKLLLPSKLPSSTKTAQTLGASDASSGHVSRIASILPRFKAAGIRAFVDTAKGGWILGQSVIRSAAATDAEGIEFNVTRLQDPDADLLVPLDSRT